MVRGAQRGFRLFAFAQGGEDGGLFAAKPPGERVASGGGDAPVAWQLARGRPSFAQQFR